MSDDYILQVTVMRSSSGGEQQEVNPKTYQFKKGDEINISIESIFRGYVYLVHLESKMTEQAEISLGRPLTLPANNKIVFDEMETTKTILLFASPTRISLFDHTETSAEQLEIVRSLFGSVKKEAGVSTIDPSDEKKKHGLSLIKAGGPIWDERKFANDILPDQGSSGTPMDNEVVGAAINLKK